MPGWFDIDHLDEEAFQAMMKGHRGFDPEGTSESIEYVNTLIEKEVQSGIPRERIVVGGFSQGGHIALRAALQHHTRLAGCVALSTWLEPSPFEVRQQHLETLGNTWKQVNFFLFLMNSFSLWYILLPIK